MTRVGTQSHKKNVYIMTSKTKVAVSNIVQYQLLQNIIERLDLLMKAVTIYGVSQLKFD
jgi:hypothetical protein